MIKKYLRYKNPKFVDCHNESQEVKDEFIKNCKQMEGYLDGLYREKELTFLLKRTSTQLTPAWKAVLLAFFNTSQFADQKRIYTKHGKKLCEQSPFFSSFMDKINTEKEERKKNVC